MSTIVVTVVNSSGDALPGASVSWVIPASTEAGKATGQGVTDNEGVYSEGWGCSPFGSMGGSVTVSKPGYKTTTVSISRPACYSFAGNVPVTVTLLEVNSGGSGGTCPSGYTDQNGQCVQNPSPSASNVVTSILSSWQFYAVAGLSVVAVLGVIKYKHQPSTTYKTSNRQNNLRLV